MSKTCGCCEGLAPLTPLATANRPGLSKLAYRAGTHATFLETMKARLSAKEHPALGGLTTRAETDLSIVLLDAWATVADVLTFYQERIANEGYLRTATERRSILELARLVGYTLRPGVAASVYLAFTLQDRPNLISNGAPAQSLPGSDGLPQPFGTPEGNLEIPAGTRAQSVPGPDELPQSFETAEKLKARAAWNNLNPRLTRPQWYTLSNAYNIDTLYFDGVATNLGPNHPLLLVFGNDDNQQVLRRVESVESQAAENRTKVKLQEEPDPRPVNFVAALLQTVEEYSRRKPRGGREGMANRIQADILDKLRGEVVGNEPPENLIASVQDKLPLLRKHRDEARDRGFNQLEGWMTGMVAELERVAGMLPARGTHMTLLDLTTSVMREPSPTTDETPASFGLTSLLAPLSEPPTPQPTNAARLERSLADAWESGADTIPRTLLALNPGLRPVLYPTWKNAAVASPDSVQEDSVQDPSLQKVYALRVTASLFGHNAPQKPLKFDPGTGAITQTGEWPIVEGSPGSGRIKHEEEDTVYLDASYEGILPGSWLVVERPDVKRPDRRPDFEGPAVPGEQITVSRKLFAKAKNPNAAVSRAEYGITGETTRIELAKPSDPTQTSLLDWIVADLDSLPVVDNVPDFQAIRRTVVYAQSEELTPAEEPIMSPICGAVIELGSLYDGLEAGRWLVVSGERADIKDATGDTVEGVQASELAMLAGVTQEVQQVRVIAGRGSTGQGGADLTIWVRLSPDGSATGRARLADGTHGYVVQAVPPSDARDFWCVNVKRTDTEPNEGDQRINCYIRDVGDGKTSFDEIAFVRGVGVDCTTTPNPPWTAWATVTTGGFKATTTGLPRDKTHSFLHLTQPLSYCYKRDAVAIYANVAQATHGETRTEVLGSGDGSKVLQQFTLKQSPLTYVAATTPTGIESTLQVHVNDIRWHEAERLIELQPTDRRFVTRTDEQDETTIIFGDGEHGARLPTGVENARAVYRTGIGKAGNVAAGRISQLAAQPLGLKGVINPLPATGGAGREPRDQARRNAPLTVMALDRLVSVRDYEDFARAFAGIGKASAARLSDGRRQLVHLTIAGADDIPIAQESGLYRNLVQALQQFGDPQQPLRVAIRELILLVISARVRVLSDYQWETVEPKIRTALLDTFSFERRELGQDALLSEAISTIQRVDGVVYVDVDVFGGIPQNTTDETTKKRRSLLPPEITKKVQDLVNSRDQPFPRVLVGMAGPEGGSIRPAQLAFLTPDVPETLILKEITA